MNISLFWIYPLSCIGVTEDLILSSIRLLEPEQDRVDVSRNNYPDNSWQEHLAELNTEEEMGGIFIIQGRDIVIPRSTISNSPACYVGANLPLTIDLSGSRARRQFGIIDDIELLEATTKRDFRANNCKLTFGYHDIFQHGTDFLEPEFIARPCVSVCLWDYGFVVRDNFKKQFCLLPSVIRLKTDFETLWGPVDCAVTTVSS